MKTYEGRVGNVVGTIVGFIAGAGIENSYELTFDMDRIEDLIKNETNIYFTLRMKI